MPNNKLFKFLFYSMNPGAQLITQIAHEGQNTRQNMVKENLSPETPREKRNRLMRERRASMTPVQKDKVRDSAAQRWRDIRAQIPQADREDEVQQPLELEEQQQIMVTDDNRNKIEQARHVIHQMLIRRQARQQFRCARLYSVDDFEHSQLTVNQYTCGLMDRICPHCQSFMWLGERTGGSSTQPQFGICCLSGKIIIPAVPDPLAILMGLNTNNDVQSKQFRKNIRKFNSGMAMASMKTNDATLAGGLASYRIQGVVYRMIGPPRNSDDQQPACLQTHFFDTEEQVRLRSVRQPLNPGEAQLDSDIYRMLSTVLTNAPNVYLMSFLTVQEQIDAGNIPPNVQVGIHADKRPDGEHARRYNLPTSNEIAILMPESTAGGIQDRKRMLVCNFRSTGSIRELQTFNETHRSYDPLQYPCLFPYGTDGWHLGIGHQRGNGNVSALQFCSNRIMKKVDSFNVLHHAGRLFQQYCVDQFAKIESGRLRYLHLNQASLRADLYNGLTDAVQSGDADRAGRRYILYQVHSHLVQDSWRNTTWMQWLLYGNSGSRHYSSLSLAIHSGMKLSVNFNQDKRHLTDLTSLPECSI